jgi:hypothetical protein
MAIIVVPMRAIVMAVGTIVRTVIIVRTIIMPAVAGTPVQEPAGVAIVAIEAGFFGEVWRKGLLAETRGGDRGGLR